MSVTSKINAHRLRIDNINNNLTMVKNVIQPLEELNMQHSIDTSTCNANPEDVVTGKKFVDYNGSVRTGTHTCQTVKLQSKSVTPTKATQNVTPDATFNGLSQVTVNPIPSNYYQVTGNLDISQNGLYNVAKYDSVTVNVESTNNMDVSYDSETKTLSILNW